MSVFGMRESLKNTIGDSGVIENMYPNKQKDIKVLKVLKKKKFIDAKMAGYIADKMDVYKRLLK